MLIGECCASRAPPLELGLDRGCPAHDPMHRRTGGGRIGPGLRCFLALPAEKNHGVRGWAPCNIASTRPRYASLNIEVNPHRFQRLSNLKKLTMENKKAAPSNSVPSSRFFYCKSDRCTKKVYLLATGRLKVMCKWAVPLLASVELFFKMEERASR